MQTKYYYWLFKDVVQEKDRKKIKRFASKSGYKEGALKDYNSKGELNNKIRNSNISFLSDQYFYDLLCPFIHDANKNAGWKYDVDWFEAVQIAEYKKDQHYSWHTDGGSDHFGTYTDEGNFKGKVRKLSLVSCISDGFDGGELEFSVPDKEKSMILRPELEIGDVIVFPSFVCHRSAPITKGIKYSVSMWCLGLPFR